MLDETTCDVETTIADKKRAAFEMVVDAMDDAEAEGIERDIVTQAALFAVLTDLVTTWGEVAVADFTEALADRILAGEFTIDRRLQ
ncbi:hypothetical protein EYW49_18470 [Siculibacillus lacustris]|uniref:Uncharacterized protein n=1 Tax=Siculibacillus lacustris TaxID=1549641 RepID=A0A4Q9VHF5_9HYPH|nr:hypothetical protein [Siculibacillus lacustris]TBW34424.1 hypothetical protein EYW49_18470 [Siculibacillus lacustris]